jgi:DNA-binding CsgD family transcriptional regulator
MPLVVPSGRMLLASLTPRLIEIAALVARGCTEREACADLGISLNTFRSHLRTLYRRLGIRSRGELVTIRAVREAVVVPFGVSDAELSALSERDTEIARLLSSGFSEKEIAGMMHASPHTVHDHVRRIYRTLGVKRRAALVAMFAGSRSER